MEVAEYLKYRKDLLEESRDEDGFISEPSFISKVLPSMLEAKLIDSDDCNESYYKFDSEKLKINGYLVNESFCSLSSSYFSSCSSSVIL